MNSRMLPEAVDELAAVIAHYGSIQSRLGERFEGAFWRAVDHLVAYPSIAPMITENARRARLRRFPWGIVYTIRPDHVLIVAVMHLHRQPDYWQERLSEN